MLRYLILIIGLAPIAAAAQNFPALNTGRASCESLWVERNQILNVAGRCFETALGQAVFDNRDCVPGPPALSEEALNRISRLLQAEARQKCAINTGAGQISIYGRYGRMRFGDPGIKLGPWPQALYELDVFPEDAGRMRNCTVTGLDPNGDDFLALRSGPDVRYPQIGQLTNTEQVISKSACMGRWCFADAVRAGNRVEARNGWFHVRWCVAQ